MSKFKSLFDATKGKQSEGDLEAPAQPLIKPRGRPKGKRSNPDFEQVTAYIRKQTHQEVKITLLQEGGDREFSELVEELLSEWLRSRT